MKKILAFILAAILLVSLVSCSKDGEETEGNEIEAAVAEQIYTDASGDKFAYEVDETGGYAITGFISGSDKPHKVEVPSEIENVEVSGIAAEAFKVSNLISEIVLPSSVKYIGQHAFFGCMYLTNVTMADSVTVIGVGAFESSSALKSITLSKNVTVIADYTFRNCSALESITLHDGITDIGESAFFACTSLKEVTVPATVKDIEDCAFYANISLTKAIVLASFESEENIGRFIFNGAADTFVFVAAEDSVAAQYAENNKYTFEKLAVAE